MACTKETVKSSGLNIWCSETRPGPAPEVDIVAVQGLGAHPFYTWVKKAPAPRVVASKRLRSKALFWKDKKTQGNDKNDGSTEVMWPRDLLLPLFKNARIATYSYESDWRDKKAACEFKPPDNRCDWPSPSLKQAQQQERQRPLILIGHSLGGLVIQQALVIAVHQRGFTDIRLSVAGIIFLGAPFQGSDAAVYGKWLAQLARLDSTLLESLEKDSPSLHALSSDFWHSYSDWDIVCFYENRDADYGPWKARFVSAQSASLLGKRMMFLNTDHSGLNKFSGMDDENFALLLPEIRRMVEGGNSVVIDRHRRQGTE
ncbi:hypothetical protein W97_04992 [Coniosporium apollinis CBS 100218]|uniref:AB hydrolase-1 domain-containing protein n=1 Tax=Coniosporium apollinis (strain CBS 100218) TaxID=1168221 RepID=R7YV84_CONA1|nr:uncharacterized protein W97_04992 [Coniosporium apollinis CBS 100218]EON65753.1 hypothetical protein W97_04992 [Coniosporium apollinis CBS 100218]